MGCINVRKRKKKEKKVKDEMSKKKKYEEKMGVKNKTMAFNHLFGQWVA